MDNNIIAEPLFQSIDTIVSNRIEGISFDTTILCSIVDTSKAKVGRYVVTNNGGITKFEAVSEKTDYKINDNVYVQIPKGDWNEQKYILYKKTTKEDEPYVYISPLDGMISSTKWTANETEWGIKANANDSKVIVDTLNVDSYQKYGYLGIVANFRTNLGNFYDESYNGPYTITEGNYGLKLILTFKDGLAAEFVLDCSDMNGNPYSFNGFYQQEKAFDISGFQNKTIAKMQLVLFEDNNFFDVFGHKYPYEEGKTLTNIFVKDIQLIFGYNKAEITGDTLIFTTTSEESSYQGITPYEGADYPLYKKGYFRWIHQLTSGDYVINPIDIDFNIYIQRKELYRETEAGWEDTNIINGWSKYGFGEYVKANEFNKWYFSYAGMTLQGEYEVDASGFYSFNIPLNYIHKDEVRDICYFSKTEVYRAFLTTGGKTYQSKDLILTNISENAIEYEDYLVQLQQKEVQDEIRDELKKSEADAGYRIYCTDGSSGFYYLYGQDGRIINLGVNRTLQIQHYEGTDEEGNPKWESLESGSSTKWIIPKNTLTIREDDNIKLTSSSNNEYEEYFVNDSYLIFQLPIFLKQNSILVQCKIKDGTLISKTLQLNKQGTAGSSYTFILDCISNPFCLKSDSMDTIKIVPKLFDANGKEMDISGQEITWTRQDGISSKTQGEEEFSFQSDAEFKESYYVMLKGEINWGGSVLAAYLPIPTKKDDENIAYFYGPTEIIYSSDGITPNFSNIPLQLYNENNELISNIIWKTNASVLQNFAPTVEENKGGYFLKPKDLYIANDCSGISLLAYKDSVLVWAQPLYIAQNKYPIGTINNWNGEIELNNGGQILSKMIAAGSKNAKNQFSGVVLGDWSETNTENSITKATGMYGFKEGQMSYAFKDDGTAFIGLSGSGRIEFDGVRGLIQSGNYDEAGSQGMQIDLSNGSIDTPNFKVDSSGNVSANNMTLVGGVIDTPQFRLSEDGKIELGNSGKPNLTKLDENGLETQRVSFYDRSNKDTIIGYIEQGVADAGSNNQDRGIIITTNTNDGIIKITNTMINMGLGLTTTGDKKAYNSVVEFNSSTNCFSIRPTSSTWNTYVFGGESLGFQITENYIMSGKIGGMQKYFSINENEKKLYNGIRIQVATGSSAEAFSKYIFFPDRIMYYDENDNPTTIWLKPNS